VQRILSSCHEARMCLKTDVCKPVSVVLTAVFSDFFLVMLEKRRLSAFYKMLIGNSEGKYPFWKHKDVYVQRINQTVLNRKAVSLLERNYALSLEVLSSEI
jgi:hypothetical protein